MTDNPMHPADVSQVSRCGAKTRSGVPSKSAGDGPAKVPDARRGRRQRCTKRQSKRNYKHGRYSAEVAATRRWLREATRMLREFKDCGE